MQDLTENLCKLVQDGWIDPKDAYKYAPNVEELKMALKGHPDNRRGHSLIWQSGVLNDRVAAHGRRIRRLHFNVKLVVFLACYFPWLLLVSWAYKDAKAVETSVPTWIGILLGGGVLAILVWWLMPLFIVGVLAYVLLVGGTAAQPYVSTATPTCWTSTKS